MKSISAYSKKQCVIIQRWVVPVSNTSCFDTKVYRFVTVTATAVVTVINCLSCLYITCKPDLMAGILGKSLDQKA